MTLAVVSGETMTRSACWLPTLLEMTTAGRVLAISEPMAGPDSPNKSRHVVDSSCGPCLTVDGLPLLVECSAVLAAGQVAHSHLGLNFLTFEFSDFFLQQLIQ